MQVSSANRPFDRNLKYRTKKKIIYLQTQRFHSIRGALLVVAYRRKFVLHSSAEFLCELLRYFRDVRNNVAFLFGKIRLEIPIERIVFGGCLKPIKLATATITIRRHLSRKTDLFTNQILGGHVTSPTTFFQQ